MIAASVVVVGGGVIGASVAYHLAARGVRDVLVLDRADRPGAGSTGAATGGFRAQFATAINVRLSLLAREKLLRFADETGVDPGYAPAGYLWIARSASEMEALRAGLRVQHAAGLTEAREVDAAEIAQLNPAVRAGAAEDAANSAAVGAGNGPASGAFCPTDGFIQPLRILEGYLGAARRLGVRIEWGIDVLGMTRGPGGRIVTVRTSRGHVSAGAVVNAAGAWAASLASMVGVDLSVAPLRRQVAATAPCELLPATMPMTLFPSDGFHLRVRDGRVLLLLPTPGVPGRPFDARVDSDWIDAVAAKIHERVPALRGVPVDRGACWAGLYEMSPDMHAILGAAPGCKNFYLANGSSGHGVMHAPALGQLLAEIVTGGEATTLDAAALRPSRFGEGAPNPTSEVL